MLGGFFANFNYAQTHTRSGENRTFTTDASTNHIWTMTNPGGVYDDIDITVSLNKAKFRNIGTGANEFGFGLAAIPANWDFTITSAKDESNNNLAVNGKSFKYTNNPTQTITVLVRVFNTDDNSTIATDARITYYLISPLTTGTTFDPCTQATVFTVSPVTMGAQKPCEDSYRLVITSTASGNVVYDETQKTNNKFSVTGLAVGNYSYVITDGCTNAALADGPGRTLTGVFSVQNAAELGTSKVFAGRVCVDDPANSSSDPSIIAVLRIRGAKKPITWVLSSVDKNGTPADPSDDIITPVYTQADTNKYTTDGDSPAATDANYTLTINSLNIGDYRFVFTDAGGCVKDYDFTVDDTDKIDAELVVAESVQQVSCPTSEDGKLTFRGFGGYTQKDDGTFKDDHYIFNLYAKAEVEPRTPIDVSQLVELAGTNPDGYKAVFENLKAGTYILKMKEIIALNTDAPIGQQEIFCEKTVGEYSIQTADPIIIEHIDPKSQPLCFGDTDGFINVRLSGGKKFADDHPDNSTGTNGLKTGYKITWGTVDGSGFTQDTDNQTGLSAGTYTITVKDANNCETSLNIKIDGSDALAVSINDPDDLKCFGDNNGQITATIDPNKKGKGPYVYSIIGNTIDGNQNTFPNSGPINDLTYTFNGLTASDAIGYSVKVTDVNVCDADSSPQRIGQPAAGMTLSGKVEGNVPGSDSFPHGDGVHLKCNGDKEGKITLTVAGGTGPYTYTWSSEHKNQPAELVVNQKDQVGLPAGVYNVTVKDANLVCEIKRRYVISEPAPLTIPTADITNAAGFTRISDFQGNKYYLSDEELTYMEARDKAAQLGGYLIAVNSEAENQMLIDDATVPSNFWIGADDIVTESKDNDNSNELWVNHKWNDGTLLTAGYTNWGNGEPNDNAKGNLNDAENYGLGEDYTEFSDGTWNDIYHDRTRRYVVEFNPSAIPDNNGTAIKCFGGNTGDAEGIDLVVTGGTGVYQYLWEGLVDDNGNLGVVPDAQKNNKNIRNLVAGKYKVTVTDASNCTVTATYTITQPPELVVSKTEATVNPLVCFDQETTITATVDTESIPGGTYKFELIGRDYNNTDVTTLASSTVTKVLGPGPGEASVIFTVKANLIGESYSVKITDANDCSKTLNYNEITQPLGLAFNNIDPKGDLTPLNKYPSDAADDIHISCFGGNDGEIDISGITGGIKRDNGFYKYTWSVISGSGVGLVTNDDTISKQTGLAAGVYKVVVKDKSDFCKIERTWTLNQPAAALDIDATVSGDLNFQITCNDKTDGRISLNLSGGTKFNPPNINADSYEITWTASANVDGDVGVIPVGKTNATLLENLPAGKYSVVVKDANNCTTSEEYTLRRPPKLEETHTKSVKDGGFNITCSGGNDGEITVVPTGGYSGDGNYTYTWVLENGASGIDVTDRTGVQTGLTAGTYKLTITDDNGCSLVVPDIILTQPTGLAFLNSDANKKDDLKEYVIYNNPVNISCNGLTNGEIDITGITGGVKRDDGTYKYTWSVIEGSGVGLVTNDDTISKQTGLAAGRYKVVVTDKSGVCNIERTWELIQPDEFKFDEAKSVARDYNGKEISCNGKTDGEITLEMLGGTKFLVGASKDSFDFTWTPSLGGVIDAADVKSQNLNNLRPGKYTVVVKDANDCSVTKDFFIEQPDPLVINETVKTNNGFNVTCESGPFGSDGEINLTISGGVQKPGVEKYDISWSGPNGFTSTAENITGLSVGNYTVTVTDRNGCTEVRAIELKAPPPIVVNSVIKDQNNTGFNITCNGEADGEIEINPSGGFRAIVNGLQNSYTYSWTAGANSDGDVGVIPAGKQNERNQQNLVAGKYIVTVTDDNGCTNTTEHEIKQPLKLEFTGERSKYNGFQISEDGKNDGTITIVPSQLTGDHKFGGASDINKEYTYSWTAGANDDGDVGVIPAGKQNEMNQENLIAGKYTLKITDSNFCEESVNFEMREPNLLTLDVETDFLNIPCFGEKTGVFTAKIAQGSVPPYTYTLNGTDYLGAPITEQIISTNAVSHTFNVRAGTYTVTVVDLNNATKTTAPETYTNPVGGELIIKESISEHNNKVHQISCNGAKDGFIEVLPEGGTLNGGQYEYTWTAVDNSDPANPVVINLPNPKNQKITGLGPGDYTVVVKDKNLCEKTKTYSIREPEKILFENISETNITCSLANGGTNDGTIEIKVSKGTGIYTFTWTKDDVVFNPADPTKLTGLAKGSYKLVLADSCETITKLFDIVEPDPLLITLDQKTDILCHGDTTGQLLVTVSGGNSPYSYNWEDDSGNTYNRDVGNVFNKGDLSNIPAGKYKLTVTDNLGCITTMQNIDVTQPNKLVVDIAQTDLNCASLSNGSITVTPSGGVGPYTYSWSDLGNGPNRIDLAAGKYTVKVTDKNLCEESVEVTIADAPLFKIDPVVTPITCFGANDGKISLNLQGGTGTVSVLWTDDATAGVNRTGLKPGSYNVVLTDDAACSINRIIQITEPRELTLSATVIDALDCVDPLSGSINLQVVGGTGPYNILWSNGEITEDLTAIGANNYLVKVTDSRGCVAEKNFEIKRPPALDVTLTTTSRIVCSTKEVYQVNKVNISGGTFPYTVTWSDGTVLGNGESMETKKEGAYEVTVTDKFSCSVSTIFNVVLPKLGTPEFDYTSDYFTQFNAYTYNDPITFTNQSTENFLSVEWDFGDGKTSTENNPVHTYTKSGSYDVTLHVTYTGGCLYSLTKTIYVGDSSEIEIPNAFTPNSDGINDAFRPVYFGFTEITLKVFDTWGTLIFVEEATTGNLKGWNGNIQGVPAENGNYIYQVTGKAFNGDLFSKNGPFTLIR